MFLDTQNQFDPAHLEPGYAQAYAVFVEANKEIMYTWGKEEIAQRFSDYVGKKVQEDLLALIEKKSVDEVQKEKDKNLAKRGQLLLVSSDEGQHFDQYLNIQEAKRLNPLSYQILSPTFRSTTTNLEEVIGEQTLLHVVKTMNENFTSLNASEKTIWSVKEAQLKGGVVHIEVNRTASNTEAQEVPYSVIEVVVDQDPSLPLVYKQIDKNGKSKRFAETQLPDEYGEAKQDINLHMPSQEEVMAGELSKNEGEDESKNVVLASSFTMLALQEAAHHSSPEQRAREAASLAKSNIEKPLAHQGEASYVPNIMAAKAAMAARFARQSQALKASQEHEMARKLLLKNQQSTVHAKKMELEKRKKARWTADQRKLAQRSAVGAGAIGGLIIVLSGSSLFVTHVTLFQ